MTWRERHPSRRTRQTANSNNDVYPAIEPGFTPHKTTVMRPDQAIAGNFRNLNGGSEHGFGASQEPFDVQAVVPHCFQNRANDQASVGRESYPHVRTNPYGLASNSGGNFNSRSSQSCGDFRGVVRNVFQQNIIEPRTSFNLNQSGCRYMANQGIKDEPQNQALPTITGRQLFNQKNTVRNTIMIPKSHSTNTLVTSGPSGSGLKSSPMHRNACGGMSSLPIVCCKSECGPFTDKWCKVMFCMSSNTDQKQEESQGWFFVSRARPVITFAQNSKIYDFPHYHISRPLFINPHQVGRRMQSIPIPNQISDIHDNFNFSVLSYNILSDELLWQNAQLYRNCPGWTLQWDYRKDNLMKEIESYNADILCFQEVYQEHFHNWLLPELVKKDYFGVFKKRTGEKSDGCATFFREDRFNCVGLREVEYRVPGHGLMDRDNIGLIVALEPKEYGRESNKPVIFVANTHLLFNTKRGDIKLLQLAKLLAEIEEMSRFANQLPQKATAEDLYSPVILCGDLNSTPFSPLYDFLTKGKLKYAGMSRNDISGQNPPSQRPSDHPSLSRDFIPKELGVSNLCQKIVNQNENYADFTTSNIENDECFVVGEKVEGKTVIVEEPGVLKHLLRLQNAYKLDPTNNKREITSTQGIVDYIMFSQGMDRTVTENMYDEGDIYVNVPRKQLYLTGTLTLLSPGDLTAMHSIPNPVLSSDHLALMVTFRLLE